MVNIQRKISRLHLVKIHKIDVYKRQALFLVAVIACGSAGEAACKVYDELDVKEYLASQKKESHFIEQNYVDPVSYTHLK